MAEEGDSGEKTEDPTQRRLTEARKDGNIGKSQDLSQVFGITAAFVALQLISPSLWEDLKTVTSASFTSTFSAEPITVAALNSQFIGLLKLLLPEIMGIMLIAAIFGAGCIGFQTNWLWSNKLLRPKFSQLNPITGLKRLFGIQNVMNTLKSIAKLCIICPIAYFAFLDLFPQLVMLIDIPRDQLISFTSYAMNYVFWKVIWLLLILGIVDVIWQKWNNKRKLKMSKHEVKDERKSIEGDEATRRRIRAIGLNRARERMFADVPSADVIVTNPTHIAVALRYEMTPGQAPKVLAKGKGYVAERIKKLAREHKIPVIERKPLARALFKAVEVGQEIPYHLYQAVAELLAYVYKIKGRSPLKAKRDQNSSGV